MIPPRNSRRFREFPSGQPTRQSVGSSRVTLWKLLVAAFKITSRTQSFVVLDALFHHLVFVLWDLCGRTLRFLFLQFCLSFLDCLLLFLVAIYQTIHQTINQNNPSNNQSKQSINKKIKQLINQTIDQSRSIKQSMASNNQSIDQWPQTSMKSHQHYKSKNTAGGPILATYQSGSKIQLLSEIELTSKVELGKIPSLPSTRC
jgi:methionine-rich copper-binding protein CopC